MEQGRNRGRRDNLEGKRGTNNFSVKKSTRYEAGEMKAMFHVSTMMEGFGEACCKMYDRTSNDYQNE